MMEPLFTEADADRCAHINARLDDGTATEEELAELSNLARKLRNHFNAGGNVDHLFPQGIAIYPNGVRDIRNQ